MNIQGLAPQTVQSKVPFITDLILHDKQLFTGLSETWTKNHKEAELSIDGTPSSDVTLPEGRNQIEADLQEVSLSMCEAI